MYREIIPANVKKKGWQIIGQAYEYKSIFWLCWKIKLEKI